VILNLFEQIQSDKSNNLLSWDSKIYFGHNVKWYRDSIA
jgi:hypothetical protein